MKRSLSLAAGVLIVAASMVAAAPVLAEPSLPTFDGGMVFSSIEGPTDPEEFSWEVTLDSDQELQQVDDQHAKVVYAGSGVTSFGITAQRAHDAVGSEVPTSLAVSDGNVLTLTVHHRAGNPATGGTPFVYPVIAGAGWEGGFETTQFTMPPPELPAEKSESTPRPVGCVVPALVGKSLRGARQRLRKAGCELGLIWGERSKAARIVKQNRQPGDLVVPGARVSVTLAQPRLAKRD